MMNPELKAAWLADLEDPANQDKQGRTALQEDGKFCCLGRLCEVAGIMAVTTAGGVNYEGCTAILNSGLQTRFGLTWEHMRKLMHFNDYDGMSFKQIAKRIRKWKTL